METPFEKLVTQVRSTDGLILVVTGAGISLASGIPTFRGTDKNAVWKREVTELGTRRYFEEAPAASWSWYLSRFETVMVAKPNPGHTALVSLEKWATASGKPFLLVTQNIDGLHAMAGSQALVEVHGTAMRVRCSNDGCLHAAPEGSLPRESVNMQAFLANPTDENVPRCPACGMRLRQHVLWFDEFYQSHRDYQWPRVLEALSTAQLVIFVGTSLAVGVTESIMTEARARKVPVFSIDPQGQAQEGMTNIAEPSEVALPNLVRVLELLGPLSN